MKKIIIKLVMVLLCVSSFAQESNQIWIHPPENLITNQAPDFIKDYLGLSNLSSFVKIKTEVDELGITHEHYQYYYNNVKVDIGTFKVHSKRRIVDLMNGEMIKLKRINTKPKITIEKAYSIATSKVSNSEQETSKNARLGELVIAENQFGNYELAYKMDIQSFRILKREWVYVSAITGRIIDRESRIHETNVPANGNSLYNGSVSFIADDTGSNFRLRQTQSGNGINTFDMNNGTNYGSAVDVNSGTTFFNGNETAVQAHWGAEQTYDYYNNTYGRNSYDNSGATINSYVSYGAGVVNAFWDGSRMTYGDGNGTTHAPLVALDIVGHEITHAVTEHTANLKYKRESGALNESFSDIFGECIENFATGTNNWRMGTDIGLSGTDGALRSMLNPNEFNQPDTYKGDNWASTFFATNSNDQGGVHTNSGVQNKWFYILTTGESGTNDNGDSYSVNGIGLDKAEEIAYRNLSVYLSKKSKYKDARNGAIQSAIDLFGSCSDEVIATTNAWYAVGVGDAFDNYSSAGTAEIKTYKFKPNELFVSINTYGGSFLLKIKNNGGSGQNMYAINFSGVTFESVDGYSYLLGQQRFQTRIQDILYEQGNTIIAFKNGKMLKINGTGGSGYNMFAVTETAGGFETVPGYSYRLGDAKFNGNITKILYANNNLIVAFNNGKMLKVNGLGGTGHNMFAVTETAGGFETVPGYSYRIGDAKFSGSITNAIFGNNKLILGFNNGKILKVNGTGGSGHNMFAVTETAGGFETIPGYSYRIGDAKFSASIYELGYFDNKLVLGFLNGKILKINGTGGSGHNMFAVTETAGGFETIPGYSYRIGNAKFSGVLTKLAYANNKLLLGFGNGKILKVNGLGGTGHNMFAVTETAGGFETVPGYSYRIGNAKINGIITDLDYISGSNILMVSTSAGNSLKINGLGGSGHNMFALSNTTCQNAYIGLPGYNYYIGFQQFSGLPLFLRGQSTESEDSLLEGLKKEEEKQKISDITVYPNPTNGIVNISLPQDAKYKGIEIYSVMGRIVHKEDAKKDRLNIAINLSNNKSGLYFIKVKFDDYVITKKIILK